MLHVGVTGTRKPLTEPQRRWLRLLAPMWQSGVVLHQGCCTGADTETAITAYAHGALIVSHPPNKDAHRYTGSEYVAVEVREPKWYHDRNRDIVDESALVLGLPDGPERPHSGTWYTLQYAASRKVPTMICYPDGHVE